jgi:hypothetical protein
LGEESRGPIPERWHSHPEQDMSSFPPSKFPKTKSKIPSRGFPKGKGKMASQKITRPPEVAANKPAPAALPARPTTEQDRQDRIAALKKELKALEDTKDPK